MTELPPTLPADSGALLEAFAAFTAASEQLQRHYEVLRAQVAQLTGELETVLDAVPWAIWVLGEQGELRFSNRQEGLKGVFEGPAPWMKESQPGLRRFRDSEGREHFFEEEHRPIPGGGSLRLLRNVTEAHLRAQQATRQERLEAMGRMAAELAHEIRNPLGSLSLFSGMLVQDLHSLPDQLDLAQKIQEGVRRLNGMVTNILTFSRDLKPQPRPIPLAAFWEDARMAVGMEERIKWSNKIPKEACWLADPELLRQVALNLLQNAVRAMEDSARPKLDLQAASEEMEGCLCWTMRLRDTGCGIPSEFLARVFDPFYSTFQGGTGLGLSVCHRVVMAHGGLLFMESEVGKGTTVHIRLPAA